MQPWSASFILLTVFALMCNRTPDLRERLLQKLEAHNRHDVTAELGFYTNDAMFLLGAGDPNLAQGKEVLRRVLECDSVLNGELLFEDIVLHGDTATVNRIVERNDLMRLAGWREVRYAPGTRFIFRDGLIRGVEASGRMEDDKGARSAFAEGLMTWMRAAHPERVREFLESLQLSRHSSNSARLWVSLITEYKASMSERVR